ncbi:MAG TPA: hypothetical protein VGM05_16605 [Planctomycetaceae bacterium]|jgi:hypothetical protein
MTTRITATVVNGMLKPDESILLADQTRVNVTIEPIHEGSATAAAEAWDAIKSQLRKRPLHFGGKRYTRDELHDRD